MVATLESGHHKVFMPVIFNVIIEVLGSNIGSYSLFAISIMCSWSYFPFFCTLLNFLRVFCYSILIPSLVFNYKSLLCYFSCS